MALVQKHDMLNQIGTEFNKGKGRKSVEYLFSHPYSISSLMREQQVKLFRSSVEGPYMVFQGKKRQIIEGPRRP